MAQQLPAHMRCAANADYFSSSSRSSATSRTSTQRPTARAASAGTSPATGGATRSAPPPTATTTSGRRRFRTSTGSLPRDDLARRGERPIGKLPLYFGANSEYVTLLRSDDQRTSRRRPRPDPVRRLPVAPLSVHPLAVPDVQLVSRWASTYWTESLDPSIECPGPGGIGRPLLGFSTRITGPVFNRIFNTPKQRLRAEIQARHRADAVDPADHARSTTSTRSCRSTAPTTSSAA